MVIRKQVLNLTWDAILFAAYAEASKEAFLPVILFLPFYPVYLTFQSQNYTLIQNFEPGFKGRKSLDNFSALARMRLVVAHALRVNRQQNL
jgi:hypothetical protein